MTEKDYEEIKKQVNKMSKEELKDLAEKMLISRFQAKIRNRNYRDKTKKEVH